MKRGRNKLGMPWSGWICILAAAYAVGLAAGGCKSDGFDGAGAAGGGFGTSSGAGGAGGAPISQSCKNACSIASKNCGNVIDFASCQKACAAMSEGPCAGLGAALLTCLSLSQKKLQGCELMTDCEGQVHDFTRCEEQQSPTDAASSGAGAGGGMGGCDAPTCGISYGGIACDCTTTCAGAKREVSCVDALGGQACTCTEGGKDLGWCFGASGCGIATSCCEGHF